MKVLSMAVLAAFSVSLVGCIGGGPNTKEIKKLWDERYYQTTRFLGRPMHVTKVSNVDCSKTEGKSGYLCSFSFETDHNTSDHTKLRLVEKDDGWVID